jgi:hypothetical protein
VRSISIEVHSSKLPREVDVQREVVIIRKRRKTATMR